MIARLTGRISVEEPESVIVDVHGVGYQVFCSQRTLSRLPEQGRRARLEIETQAREHDIRLYGFIDAPEKSCFRLLIGVQGVGAKAALALLSTLEPETLLRAIAAQDRAALSRAPGVGARLAGRIVSELQDQAGALMTTVLTTTTTAPGTPMTAAGEQGRPNTILEDAVSTLVNLGYTRGDALAAAGQALALAAADQKEDLPFVIRAALKTLTA